MKLIPWAIIACLLLAATAFWLGTKTGLLPPEPVPDSDPGSMTQEQLPPLEVFAEEKTPTLVPPDGFPKTHRGFLLESVKKEDLIEGVTNYFVARYVSDDGSEVSARFLSLTPTTSEKFSKSLLKALVSGGTVHSAGQVSPAKKSGWTASHLFSREDAGIYVATSPAALLMISAPSTEIASDFGSSLSLPETPARQ
jgi:hypothetical protein